MIEYLEIEGLRGFGIKRKVEFAIPDGEKHGSGLTVLVGANNSGKSTVLEAISDLLQDFTPGGSIWASKSTGTIEFTNNPEVPEILRNQMIPCKQNLEFANPNPIAKSTVSYPRGKRNEIAKGKVNLFMKTNNGFFCLKSVESMGSELDLSLEGDGVSVFILSPKRYFEPFFGRNDSTQSREDYLKNRRYQRKGNIEFSQRIYKIQGSKESKNEYDELIGIVLGYDLDWNIEGNDNQQYYINIKNGINNHSTEGVGDGIISIMAIIDALYDSKSGDSIVIDEPESSLHPALQKRLYMLLEKFSVDRQIIIATHSPYFINSEAILNGSKICRFTKNRDGNIDVFCSDKILSENIKAITKDEHNIHVLGLDAKEIFFQEDGVVLVEGQEDIIYFKKLFDNIDNKIDGHFFGWGVGGAPKMVNVARILDNLGYKKVMGILDADKAGSEAFQALNKEFNGEYLFIQIPAEDVRSKPSEKKAAKEGLFDLKHKFQTEKYGKAMNELIDNANIYMRKSAE